MKRMEFGSARETFRIAGPVLVENLMASMVTMINTAMVGSLGRAASATVAVNSSPIGVLSSIPMGLGVGSMVMVARYIGAGKRDKADDVANQTLGGTFLMALILGSMMTLFASRHIPRLINVDPAIRDNAVIYLRIVSLGIIPNFIGLACSATLRGTGNTKTPMLAGLMTNVIIVILNFILLFEPLKLNLGFFSITLPRPALGVMGAAISTVVAQTIFGLYLLSVICGKNQMIRVSLKKIFTIKWETLRPVLKVGLPAVGERLTISIGQVMYQTTVNSLGAAASSAHHIATQIESMSFMPGHAFGVAATALVGRNLGAKDKEAAQKYANTSLAFGLGIGLICFIVFTVFPRPLMGLFIKDAEVIGFGTSALRLIAPVEPFFCVLIVITGILRGGGDTQFALIAGLVGMWGIRIGLAYFAVNVLQLSLVGAWIGMAADIMARFVIMFLRYRHKKWLNTEEI